MNVRYVNCCATEEEVERKIDRLDRGLIEPSKGSVIEQIIALLIMLTMALPLDKPLGASPAQRL
jgi:hypothetical protein